MSSVGRPRGVRIEESPRLARKGFVELKERAVAGVWLREQNGIGQVLTQPTRVADRDHLVVYAVYDEYRLLDALQIREAVAGEVFPVAEGGHLRGSYGWAGAWFQVIRTLRQSRKKRFACRLASFTRVAAPHQSAALPDL